MSRLSKGLPGTYVLVLECAQPGDVVVGRLGRLEVREGYYVYIGSAFGPGGVRARVARHLRADIRRHWHVDYLRERARVVEVWYREEAVRREHEWAVAVGGMRAAEVARRGFGCSDCRCETHLFYFPRQPAVRAFRRRVGAPVYSFTVGGPST